MPYGAKRKTGDPFGDLVAEEELAAHQVVGEVKAHQAIDG